MGKVDHVLFTSTILDREDTAWAELAVLVRQAQAGDRDAFGSLVEQFQPTVYAIALRRLGNPSDALELTQDVFLHVLERITQLREPERFAGWLRQVAVRMAINRATRRVAPPSVEAGHPGRGLDAERRAARSIDRPRAGRAGLGGARDASSRWIARRSTPSTSAATRWSRSPRCSTCRWEPSSAGCTRRGSG